MIRGLLQGLWNIGHHRRYALLEERVVRLEYWVRVHAPFVSVDVVASPYEDYYDPLSAQALKRAANRFHGFLAVKRKRTR